MTSLITSDIARLDKIKEKQVVIKYMLFVSIYRNSFVFAFCMPSVSNGTVANRERKIEVCFEYGNNVWLGFIYHANGICSCFDAHLPVLL